MSTQLRGTPLPQPRFRIAPLPADLGAVPGFRDLQTFFPALSKLYRLSKHQSQDVWLDSAWRISRLDISGTSGPCRVGLVANIDVSGTAAEINPPTMESRRAYLKVTHLLDPVRWMQGNYSLPKHSGLPWHGKTWITASNKLQDPWNQAYVEAVASYALGRLREAGASPHFNEFYGAFCARADCYRYNLTDEYGSFRNVRWFWHGQKKGLFALKLVNAKDPGAAVQEELVAEMLQMPSEESLESGSAAGSSSEAEAEESEEELPVDGEESASEKDLESLHSGGDSELSFAEQSNSGDSAASSASDDSDETEYRIYAEIRDFPVMMIAIEENNGTMDDLLEDSDEVGAEPGSANWEERWSAWLFQVIAALSCAQTLLGFTHNDLHTNNIVWIPTEEKYLWYTTRDGRTFRVPTFGKLFRVIDFGRAIFSINGKQFISDDFRQGNDADGQYCFKPLHPRPTTEVPPNPSFDLCRLAVSLFDGVFPEKPEEKVGGEILSDEEDLRVRETVSPLYNLLWSWMIDDDGCNVLVEADGEERFPDFDLYKHIAAKIHKAVPALQFGNPALARFQVSAGDMPANTKSWSLFC
jgi:hypothetical protein